MSEYKPIHDLRPAWVECAVCGVTQPLESLQHHAMAPNSGWFCVDLKRCAAMRIERLQELAEFERQHPLLVVREVP